MWSRQKPSPSVKSRPVVFVGFWRLLTAFDGFSSFDSPHVNHLINQFLWHLGDIDFLSLNSMPHAGVSKLSKFCINSILAINKLFDINEVNAPSKWSCCLYSNSIFFLIRNVNFVFLQLKFLKKGPTHWKRDFSDKKGTTFQSFLTKSP